MLLNCHTYYSYKFGTLPIEQLIQEAKDKAYDTIVLTDINSTSGCIEFIRQCTEQKIKPVLGIDFRNGAQQQYLGIAMNNEGFQELNEHLTYHLHSEKEFPKKAPSFNHAYVIYPSDNHWIDDAEYQSLKKNEYIGIHPRINKFIFSKWSNFQNKLVILQPVTFKNKQDFNIHRLLRAIDNNTLLSKLPKTEEARPDEIMLPKQDVYQQLFDYPFIIQNTKRMVDNCSINFEFKTSKNKNTFTGSPFFRLEDTLYYYARSIN